MKQNRFVTLLLPAVAAVAMPLAMQGEDAHETSAPAAHGAAAKPEAPYKVPDAEAPHAHVEKFGEAGHARRYGTLEQRWKARLKEARALEDLGKDEAAEKIFWELSGPPYTDSLNRDAYPILIDYYASRGERAKLIELYEKFSQGYRDDPELPEIYFRLGNLYREFGAYELAQSRFYNVLSTTIRGARTPAEQEEFRQTSLRAQIEIADIYLELGDNERATQYFDRLLRLDDLDPANVARAEFKRAYAKYHVARDLDVHVQAARKALNQYLFEKTEAVAKESGQAGVAALDTSKDARVLALNKQEAEALGKSNEAIAKVIRYLTECGPAKKAFYDAYPDHEHAPEAHYLLATVYKWQDTEDSRNKAHAEVVLLLEKANKGIRSERITLQQDEHVSLRFVYNDALKTWETATGREATQTELARISQELPRSNSNTEVFLSAEQQKPNAYDWDKASEQWQDSEGKPVDEKILDRISKKVDQWVRWQKKAGNQLANKYFEEGKNVDAIGIYQKLLALDPSPKWQAPIVYQLGLCFERIGGKAYNPKAIEAYEILTVPDKNPETWKDWSKKMEAGLGGSAKNLDANLAGIVQNQEQFIYRMAEWRLRNLRWNRGASNEVKRFDDK